MIATIARKEILEMLRDGRFRAAGAIVFLLLAVALLLGWRNHRDLAAQHAEAQRATRAQWLAQGKKNPHSAAHYGVYAFKPKLPLSLLDRGTEPYTGVAVWLEAHRMNDFKYRPAQDATAMERLGELTAAAILQLLVPLVIVLLSFQAFSGEYEAGTLRQLLSLGVPRARFAAGKALGVSGALALLLVPAALTGTLALAVSAEGGDLTAFWPRFGWMVFSYLLYFAIFTALCLAVSATVTSSRLALVLLLGFWIWNGLVAPRAATDLAKAIVPTPSAFAFARSVEQALKNGIDGHTPQEERDRKLIAALLEKYKVDRVEALPVNFAGIRLQESENHGNQVYDSVYGNLWKQFDRQEQVHRLIGLLAPALAVRSLSMAFAGTDFAHHAHFATAAEQYRRQIQRIMNDDLTHNAVNVRGTYVAGEDLWKKVPPFHYTAPDAHWVLARQRLSWGVLTLWLFGAAWLLIRAAGRLRVA